MLTNPTTRRHTAGLVLLAGLVLYALSEPLLSQAPGVTAEGHLGAVFSYYLKDGGVWRQDNEEHDARSDSPVAYIKRYQWGPGRAIVVDDTFALMADGECQPWTHNVFHWDIAESAVRGQVFHRAGVWASGLIRMAAEHQSTAEFTVVLPDGTESKMRDRTDLSDPHRAVVTAFLRDREAWKEGDQVSWAHVTTRDKPCGF